MFFEKISELNLKQYFDETFSDVRVAIWSLFERTRDTVARERSIGLEVVLLIGCLEMQNAAVNLGLWRREDLAQKLGLTPNQYWKRAQAGRILIRHPEFIDLIKTGKTHVSHVALLSPKITDGNKEIFLAEIAGKSEREVRELVTSVNKDGSRNTLEPTFDLKISLTKSQLALLDRAREVLSGNGRIPSEEEVFVKALGDLLNKRDPVRKAERAVQREEKQKLSSATSAKKGTGRRECAEPSTKKDPLGKECAATPVAPPVPSATKEGSRYIPAPTRHLIFVRSDSCSFVGPDGRRCGAKSTLQIDHVLPVALGGSNDPANLRLLCREHNVSEGIRLLGEQTMKFWEGDGI